MRLKGYDYSQSGAYFVTICTYQHQSLFGTVVGGEMVINSYGKVVGEEWFKSARIRSEIELFTDEFVVMPNHIHGIIWIVKDPSVGATHGIIRATHGNVRATRGTERATRGIVRATQRVAPTRPCGPRPGSIGAIIGQYKSAVTKRINQNRESHGEPIWQRNYHDHIIRDETELVNIRAYIADNPRRWTEDRYHPEKVGS
jgi:REP element-mobilizing transposase RayT